jgi:hypothetical protein
VAQKSELIRNILKETHHLGKTEYEKHVLLVKAEKNSNETNAYCNTKMTHEFHGQPLQMQDTILYMNSHCSLEALKPRLYLKLMKKEMEQID